MCGRYQIDDELKDIIEKYDIEGIVNDVEHKIGEIYPSNNSMVIVKDKGERIIRPMKFGMYLDNYKKHIINARNETVFEKSLFKNSILSTRCLVVANYFYEWESIDKKKIKHEIQIPNSTMFLMAAIYRQMHSKKYGDYKGFVILTKQASKDMESIHDRMPVMIKDEDMDLWLNENSRESLEAIIERSYDSVLVK